MMKIEVLSSGSKGNAYLVTDGRSTLLLEAGVEYKKLVKSGALSKVDACLITHEHDDHSKSARGLTKFGMLFVSGFGTLKMLSLSTMTNIPIRSGETVEVSSFLVTAFRLVHDAIEPLGYLITSKITGERLLFFTDTASLNVKFDGVTHIIGECNYSQEVLKRRVERGEIIPSLARRIIASHMSLETLLSYLKQCDLSKLKEIYLAHLSDGNSDEVRMKEEVQKLTGVPVYIAG